MPTRTDAMYALCASMTAYAREHRDDMKRIANSIIYAQQMAPDFSTVLLKDYMYIEKDYRRSFLISRIFCMAELEREVVKMAISNKKVRQYIIGFFWHECVFCVITAFTVCC